MFKAVKPTMKKSGQVPAKKGGKKVMGKNVKPFTKGKQKVGY